MVSCTYCNNKIEDDLIICANCGELFLGDLVKEEGTELKFTFKKIEPQKEKEELKIPVVPEMEIIEPTKEVKEEPEGKEPGFIVKEEKKIDIKEEIKLPEFKLFEFEVPEREIKLKYEEVKEEPKIRFEFDEVQVLPVEEKKELFEIKDAEEEIAEDKIEPFVKKVDGDREQYGVEEAEIEKIAKYPVKEEVIAEAELDISDLKELKIIEEDRAKEYELKVPELKFDFITELRPEDLEEEKELTKISEAIRIPAIEEPEKEKLQEEIVKVEELKEIEGLKIQEEKIEEEIQQVKIEPTEEFERVIQEIEEEELPVLEIKKEKFEPVVIEAGEVKEEEEKEKADEIKKSEFELKIPEFEIKTFEEKEDEVIKAFELREIEKEEEKKEEKIKELGEVKEEIGAKVIEFDTIQRRIKEAKILERKGKNKQAIEMYLDILNQQPENKEILFYLSNIYRRSGDMEKACEYFERVVKMYPEDTHLRCNYAGILVELNRIQDAITELETALRFDPNDVLCLVNLRKLKRFGSKIKHRVKKKRRKVFV
ncbi:MAG: tetratricopeptide repeat protein [Candidatus Hydrogenedentota bacterium]